MAGGGGAWKVAYADFVTAMMAFFMVMWLVGQKESTKEAVAEYFRDPPNPFEIYDQGAKSKTPGMEGERKPEHQPQPDLPPEEVKKARPVRFQTSDRSNVGSLIFFDEFSAELSDEAREQLHDLLPMLAGKPQKIEIRGHASRRPLPADSPHGDAWHLCYQRCQAVMHYLEKEGIPADRLRLSQSAGYEPMTRLPGGELQDKNPRVEVFLLNEIVPSATTLPISHNAAATH